MEILDPLDSLMLAAEVVSSPMHVAALLVLSPPEGEDPEVALKRVQGMIDSMTKQEKNDPDMIDTPRRRRIAKGAGVEPQEVNQFLKQFDQVRGLMKQMATMSTWQRL
jgi:signal recognition particle subunit SRP54